MNISDYDTQAFLVGGILIILSVSLYLAQGIAFSMYMILLLETDDLGQILVGVPIFLMPAARVSGNLPLLLKKFSIEMLSTFSYCGSNDLTFGNNVR